MVLLTKNVRRKFRPGKKMLPDLPGAGSIGTNWDGM